jgi:hypothetical protein
MHQILRPITCMVTSFDNFHNTGSGKTLLPPEGNLHKINDVDFHQKDLPETGAPQPRS